MAIQVLLTGESSGAWGNGALVGLGVDFDVFANSKNCQTTVGGQRGRKQKRKELSREN